MPRLKTGVSLVSLAAVLPATALDNAELEQRFGQAKIASALKASGIVRRRVAGPSQHASDFALTAAERVLRHAGIDRSEIDLLLFVSQTPDYRIPPTATILHAKLGLPETCAALDINQACSAFPYALALAHGMIAAGTARHALILNADTLTRLIHPQDRGLVVLHGDGAAATLLGPVAGPFGLESLTLGADGAGAAHLRVVAGGSRRPPGPGTRTESTDDTGCIRTLEHLEMNGPAVFHFSVFKVPEVIRHALAQAGLTFDDIDLVVLHQANQMMLDLIYKSLRVPAEKRFVCIREMGNSSGPSTPIALAEAWRQGRISPGSRTLVCSFGAGLTWGVAVIRWPEDAAPVPSLDPVVPDQEMLSAAL